MYIVILKIKLYIQDLDCKYVSQNSFLAAPVICEVQVVKTFLICMCRDTDDLCSTRKFLKSMKGVSCTVSTRFKEIKNMFGVFFQLIPGINGNFWFSLQKVPIKSIVLTQILFLIAFISNILHINTSSERGYKTEHSDAKANLLNKKQ